MSAGRLNAKIILSAENDERAVDYIEALHAVGIEAERIVVLVPDRPHSDARQLAAQAAGLVLAGGEDVDPRHYGEEAIPEAGNDIVEARDRLELELLAGAQTGMGGGSVPVWGICRGLQVINVYLGGSLYQDISLQVTSDVAHQVSRPWDALIHEITPTNHCAGDHRQGQVTEIIRRQPMRVNSRHHQAVKELGRDLATIARSADGLVEAVVGTHDEWWLSAVQWHPENLVALPQQRALWRSFVEATEHFAAKSTGHGAQQPTTGAK